MSSEGLGFMRKYLALVAILSAAGCVQNTGLALRIGQGGFRDDRAPDGKLGGGQVCLDMKFKKLPLSVSIGHEYYTKGPDATELYEIKSLYMGNVFFARALTKKWPTDLYLGGGIGLLKIPPGDKAAAIQAIVRINTKIVWKIGIYAEGKYLYSNSGPIDFDAAILLVGISITFDW